MSGKTALVPIATGSEEIEAVCIIDTLRRADVTVTVAAVSNETTVVCSRGVVLTAETLLTDLVGHTCDLIALPGGMPGAEHLRDCTCLATLLRDHASRGKLLGAICAAPAVVLLPLGLLEHRIATCHPSFFAELVADRRREDRVVIDGNLVTSRSPGTAIEFALTLVDELLGPTARATVAGPMLVRQ